MGQVYINSIEEKLHFILCVAGLFTLLLVTLYYYALPLVYSSTRHLYVCTHLRAWSWVKLHDKKKTKQIDMVFNVYPQTVNSDM